MPQNPCDPSPCGPNTQCTVLSNGFSKCTCLPGYVESPNTIRGCIEPKNPCEPNPCGFGAICDSSRSPPCFCPEPTRGNPYKQCTTPSVTIELCKPGPCGRNADCYVVNNREQCFCKAGYVGDPYSECKEPPRSICEPNPCGSNAECVISPTGQSMCVCPEGMGGDPTSITGCRGYECQVDNDCSSNKACIGFKCQDPCPGACGKRANCKVEQHHPVCYCNNGLTGNPLTGCYPIDIFVPSTSPCQPSPCGVNTQCNVMNNRAVCSCLPDYLGDPQTGCHPECVINSDCPTSMSCINRKCINPCEGAVCGINAECRVVQHTPECVCINNFVGDASLQCTPISVTTNVTRDPCVPSPCGPQDVCSIGGNGIALCDPCFGANTIYNPRCRPECLSNSDCAFDKACIGQKCIDPCPGSCGHNAICTTYEHNPICSCPQGLYGNPFEHCSVSLVVPSKPETCDTVRCGSNAECKERDGALSCVCLPGYYGDALIGCRPECVLNTDCPSNKACMNFKCVDPCTGLCGSEAVCQTVNHAPVCYCPRGLSGDPFISCTPYYLPPDSSINPCEPSPCGPNSRCQVSNEGYAACSCLPGYRGSPPVCQPECVVNSECPQNKACLNNKCIDPCPGTCGLAARCEVLNHNPVCSCQPGYQGDPFISCSPVIPEKPEERKPENPCMPSPCGPNSICQIKQGHPVCSCVANYIGNPPYCRPECTLNSECPQNKACIQEKCQDPCVGSCGANAKCDVIAHSSYCSCLSGYEGDAFTGCTKTVERKQKINLNY